MIRSTRLVDRVNTMDLRLVAFGMSLQATLIHLADREDDGRLPPQRPVTAPDQRL
ncbi:hypothetical protein [Streptomyces yerevanensis]|uniref:hypothetical protein n=1 Tax=Streptomyces yerevanensis TaxID=66378 RepID=UPI000A5B3193|nr:hypothetical protein [Streptomyces yerevanensis]